MNLYTSQLTTAIDDQKDIDFVSRLSKQSQERVRLYRTRQPPEKGEPESYPIDHNHTHFLLLEDEFEDGDKKWRDAVKHPFRADLILSMRAQIEQESRKITQQGRSKDNIGLIMTICLSIFVPIL